MNVLASNQLGWHHGVDVAGPSKVNPKYQEKQNFGCIN